MPRLLFEKTGNAIWISHLDLMRLFQRAFKRAGLPLKHTQGFNPRPSVSIALPLSVGVESKCELLDFDLDGFDCSCQHIKEKLQNALIDGITVVDCYENGRKIRELSLLENTVTLAYQHGVPEGAAEAISNLFKSNSILVTKKSKNGPVQQDIIPMIRSLTIEETELNTICVKSIVCCQNPSLNPQLLVQAIENNIPEYKPDFSKCIREEIYDNNKIKFR